MQPNQTEAQILQEIIESWDDLKAMLHWFKERKRAPSIARDADHETQRQTYHVQQRYIEAIRRASDLERVSIAEIVNRAFEYYFNQKGDTATRQ
jgi:hypothetical protein